MENYTDYCAALEKAAYLGNTKAARMLLEAGSRIETGIPLYCAAKVFPPGVDTRDMHPTPNKEFDQSRIPVMELLVERGADVNQRFETHTVVAPHPIVAAGPGGGGERVRFVLEKGANTERWGLFGSTVNIARRCKNEEMRRVVEEGLAARRWVTG